jgi:hypothetical protein
MKRRGLVSLLLTCAVGVIAGVAAVSPANAAGVFMPIRNEGNFLCLQPASAAAEAAVVQAPCNGSIAQGWWFQQTSASNRYHIVSQLSGLCMNAFGATANYTPVLMIDCVTVSNEEWKSSVPVPEIVTLMSRAGWKDSGFCIDVPGGASTVGLAVQIYGCNGTLAQRWNAGLM